LLPGTLEKLCKDFGLTDNAKKDLSDIMKEQGMLFIMRMVLLIKESHWGTISKMFRLTTLH
ncbi:hypothetical protein, partial [Bacillus cereus]|uniref:hypothetical protein n=1 Tax=Bacillus cereus TaxID=1396 RepID=UPI00396EFB0E